MNRRTAPLRTIDTSTASARDIGPNIDLVQAEVERVHGIRLIPEVRRVGDQR